MAAFTAAVQPSRPGRKRRLNLSPLSEICVQISDDGGPQTYRCRSDIERSNDSGLDARRSIHLDNLVIEFKQAAPSKLYWAGRPAMRVVQALRWLKDTLPTDRDRILARLTVILNDRRHGKTIRDDLRAGIRTLPAWMQAIVRELLD
jgi:hypothetical protein